MHCKVDPRTLGSDLFQGNFDPDVPDLTDVGAEPDPDMSVARVGAGRWRFAPRFDPDCNSVSYPHRRSCTCKVPQNH